MLPRYLSLGSETLVYWSVSDMKAIPRLKRYFFTFSIPFMMWLYPVWEEHTIQSRGIS